jgi:hypothetical protein
VAFAKRILAMRAILLAVASLAAAKVWTQDHFVRVAMGDALILAYRERAQVVCSRETSKDGAKDTVKAANASVGPWARDAHAAITIGSKISGVMLWDYNNPLWDVRYRHPHLVLTATGARAMTCSYDLTAGVAFVRVM